MTKQNKKIFVSHMYLLFISLYSQTSVMLHDQLAWGLLSYKFTLLSNKAKAADENGAVLLPYKFTLLSNLKFGKATLLAVHLQGRNYHYNITFLIASQLYHA